MKLNIIIILLILTGCKQKNNSLALFSDVIPNQYEKNVHDMDIASSQAIDIAVDKNQLVDKIKISSWVDSITFVQLSSSDNALIGSINKLIRKSNDIYILDRYKTKSLKKFNINGEFITDIGRFGEAPGEYQEPTDFIVNDSLIIVYDQFASRFNYYTLDGNFQYSKKLPFLCLRFKQVSVNNFIFYTQDADNQHLSSIENYSIFQTDSNFVIKERCFYRERDKYTSIINDYNFVDINNRLYCHPSFSGKIYEILNDGKYALKINLNFGKHQLPEEYLLKENWNDFKNESAKDRYSFFLGEYLITNDVLYFSYTQQHEAVRCFYSFKDKKLARSSIMVNDILPIFPFANFIGVDGNTLVSYVFPSDIIAIRDNYSSSEWYKMVGEKAFEITKQLKNEDNPFIVWYHLKKQ